MGIILDLIAGRQRGIVAQAMSMPTNLYAPPEPALVQLVVSDLMGEDAIKNIPLDRAAAISIPAVSKARNLLVSTISKFPLRAIRRNNDGTDTDVTTEHPWLYRTNGSVAPYERMAWTVDDLIFYGCSLWLLERGTPEDPTSSDKRRPILNAEWCPFSSWSIKTIDGTPRVVVDDVPIADDRYMLINSPFEGLLNIGMRTLRGARDTEESWVGRAKNPIPLIELHVTDDTELEKDEIKEFVKAFAEARTQPNGAIGYTPAGVEIRVHGEVKAEMAVEGRNAIRTDIGSHLNIRASMLDGTMGVDSLTYTTTAGEKNSFYEFDLPFWTDPIAARISLDDIVPRGTRIRFDMYEAFNQPAATGAPMED